MSKIEINSVIGLEKETTMSKIEIDSVIGLESEPKLHDALHHLSHHGSVEYLHLDTEDMHRKRLRATTDGGRECLITLNRTQKLQNGTVLYIDDSFAIVIRARKTEWLVLEPASIPDAVELGYFAGNMHWRVAFDGPLLKIALDGNPASYMDRIPHFIGTDRVKVIANG